MKGEIIETGKTVEDAINSACLKLGIEREDCEWEIIDLPKKGFLGLKNIPAKVRVTAQLPDREPEKKAAPPRQERPVREKPSGEFKAIRQEPKPRPEQKPRPPKAVKEPQPKEKKPVEAPKPKPPVQAAPMPEPKPQPKPELKKELPNYHEAPPTPEVQAKAATAQAYLSSILKELGLEVAVEQVWEEGGVCLTVKGDGLGAIIGRRGETLDALQYLSGLVANRMEGDYLRVTVDCGDYRLKRKATLEALARKVSSQVLKTNVSKTLEPMNPFERRIIHATVSTIEGVSSTSVGEEPNRRVVITSPTAKSPRRSSSSSSGGNRGRSDFQSGSSGGRPDRDRRDRNDSRGDRGGRGGDRGGRRERPEPYQPVKEPDHPPTEAENQPLYGKISLD